MERIIQQLGPDGQILQFENFPGLYPVNRYQSLVLAQVAHSEVLSFSAARWLPLADLRVMEACCGSGPAAIFLKSAQVGQVVASDINPKALDVCRHNVHLNKLALDAVVECDILNPSPDMQSRFDLVVCNPPCGRSDDCPADASDDFRLAVDGGAEGISFVLDLLDSAMRCLRSGGRFLVVLTSSTPFRLVEARLNQQYPGSWRLAHHTPIAQPWKKRDSASADRYLKLAENGEVFVWDGNDGWIWRLTWIIVLEDKGIVPPQFASNTRLWLRNASYDVPDQGYQRLLKAFEQ